MSPAETIDCAQSTNIVIRVMPKFPSVYLRMRLGRRCAASRFLCHIGRGRQRIVRLPVEFDFAVQSYKPGQVDVLIYPSIRSGALMTPA